MKTFSPVPNTPGSQISSSQVIDPNPLLSSEAPAPPSAQLSSPSAHRAAATSHPARAADLAALVTARRRVALHPACNVELAAVVAARRRRSPPGHDEEFQGVVPHAGDVRLGELLLARR